MRWSLPWHRRYWSRPIRSKWRVDGASVCVGLRRRSLASPVYRLDVVSVPRRPKTTVRAIVNNRTMCFYMRQAMCIIAYCPLPQSTVIHSTVTDKPSVRLSISQSVCLSCTFQYCVKMAAYTTILLFDLFSGTRSF